MDTIRYTIENFDATAHRITARYVNEDDATRKALDDFIVGCRYYCTGNLAWRYDFRLSCLATVTTILYPSHILASNMFAPLAHSVLLNIACLRDDMACTRI